MRPTLDAEARWEVRNLRNSTGFFVALADLLPSGSILYLEGTIAADVRAFLEARSVPPALDITAENRPRSFRCHVPVTIANMSGLEDIARAHAEPEICIHMHGYRDQEVLFTWYDAFDDPLWIRRSIPEAQVRAFCQELGANFVFVGEAV